MRMKFRQLGLDGVFLIQQPPVADTRGALRRHFCAEEYSAHGLNPRVVQSNLSHNFLKRTLRGFHYQEPPHQECKTLSCLSGSIWDVVLDLRPRSWTFGRWAAVELDSGRSEALYLPAGCANAFLTLEDNTLVHYFMSEFYTPESYRGVRYNDPAFGVRWPAEPDVISEKDASYPDWESGADQAGAVIARAGNA